MKVITLICLFILYSFALQVEAPTKCLIDLHNHLDGAFTVEIAKALAEKVGYTFKNSDNITVTSDEDIAKLISVGPECRDLEQFLAPFSITTALMQTAENIKTSVYLVLENIKKQGLIYTELRFAPQQHTAEGLTQKQAVQAALEGLKMSDLKANLILCMMRGEDKEELHNKNLETIELVKEMLKEDGGVVAIDIAGDEYHFPNELFQAEFEKIRGYNLPMTIHAGEALGYESVESAIEYGAHRIGHGVRSYENDDLVKEIILKKIPLAFCPTSNAITKVIKEDFEKKYPLKDFLNKGVKVHINTDDMGICGTTLVDEFKYIIKTFDITEDDITQLMLNSADAAFTSETVRRDLKRQIIEYRYGIEENEDSALSTKLNIFMSLLIILFLI